LSTLHRFPESGTEVKVSRKAYENAVPAIFRTAEILEAAGARVTKTHVVAPLSAFRFLRGDEDAKAFAVKEKADLRKMTYTVRNTGSLRSQTIPWAGQRGTSGYAALYAEAIESGKVADSLSLSMVRPVTPVKAKPKAASKPKARAAAKK
jgi:hypothetical protein